MIKGLLKWPSSSFAGASGDLDFGNLNFFAFSGVALSNAVVPMSEQMRVNDKEPNLAGGLVVQKKSTIKFLHGFWRLGGIFFVLNQAQLAAQFLKKTK